MRSTAQAVPVSADITDVEFRAQQNEIAVLIARSAGRELPTTGDQRAACVILENGFRKDVEVLKRQQTAVGEWLTQALDSGVL